MEDFNILTVMEFLNFLPEKHGHRDRVETCRSIRASDSVSC